MLVLGIESTCDETGCAIVASGKKILSNIIASQDEIHRALGGVMPELACRRHVDVLSPIVEQALETASVTLNEIDALAVAHGPGLIGALLIGVNFAKGLALATKKPLVGVNHIEAHLYAAMMDQEVRFPALGVVVSGGHTALVLIQGLHQYQLIGQTQDDALGEAFDKVAKLLGLPYPGGPYIERLAKLGDPYRYPFKGGQVKGRPFDFSFSGLKTAVLYTVKGHRPREEASLLIQEEDKKDIAASFQHTACSSLVEKIISCTKHYGCQTILLGGGVTQNGYLRSLLEEKALCPILWPAKGMCLDNAAMIAALGFHNFIQKKSFRFEVQPRLPLDV